MTIVTKRVFNVLSFVALAQGALEGIDNAFSTLTSVPGRRDLAKFGKTDEGITSGRLQANFGQSWKQLDETLP